MPVANRIIMVFLALTLAVLGGVTVLETTLAMLGRPGETVSRPDVHTWLGSAEWSDPVLVAVAVSMVVVGLVLLAFQLKPRRLDSYVSRRSDERRTLTIDRHGLETLAEQTVGADPDCDGARAKLRRRRLRVSIDVYPDRDPASVEARVKTQILERLSRLELERAPKVRLTSSTADSRAR